MWTDQKPEWKHLNYKQTQKQNKYQDVSQDQETKLEHL